MSKQLMDEAYLAIEKVESLINKKIKVVVQEYMGTQVAMEYISQTNNQPSIFIGSACTNDSSHLVACKAAQILRMEEAKEEDRFLPIATKNHLSNAKMQLEGNSTGNPYIKQALQDEQIVNTWVFSLINQVVSQPSDICIQKWVKTNFPGLAPLQEKMINHQLTDFLTTETKEVKELSPKVIFDASEIMNSVYLIRIDDVLGTDFSKGVLEKIFRKKKAVELLDFTRKNQVDNLVGDIAMTNAWADFLKIRDWYDWMALYQ